MLTLAVYFMLAAWTRSSRAGWVGDAPPSCARHGPKPDDRRRTAAPPEGTIVALRPEVIAGGRLDDVFAIQDEITGSVVACIQPEVYTAEHERLKRTPPHRLDAWESFVRAMFLQCVGCARLVRPRRRRDNENV